MAETDLDPKFDYVFKVVVIGDSGVGKTSILINYVEDGKFNEEEIPSLNAENYSKIIDIDGQKVKLNILDTADQERMGFLTSSYYRGAHGILICFSLNDDETFKNVENWIEEIERYAAGSTHKVLVGNKSDLETVIDEAEATRYAEEELSSVFIKTSAKTGDNIVHAFDHLASVLKDKSDAQKNNKGKTSAKNTLELGGERSDAPRGKSGGGRRCALY